ncbi:phage holin family protein [Crenothrix polyspora]|uniref:LydA holin phage, holin superfamily III n=1 Tax=Crenothrix polyspora TaxID=360316 RepID=A0A1R4H183_9GAMM|nr:phage holin family protein [Crenothrix polyspora]SJM89981.1 conserved membrane hypothetical protein [Crenothrix polyspora]
MIDKDPMAWDLATWLLGFGIGVVGGALKFFSSPQMKDKKLSAYALILDIVTSGFVSLIAFMALNTLEVPIGLSVSLGGVCGHMSTRLLFLIERIIERKIKAL